MGSHSPEFSNVCHRAQNSPMYVTPPNFLQCMSHSSEFSDVYQTTQFSPMYVTHPGLSDCIGYWYWVYNIFVYWVFPIHKVYFVILPIQYNTIQYYEKVDRRKVKYMRETLRKMKRKRKRIPRSE